MASTIQLPSRRQRVEWQQFAVLAVGISGVAAVIFTWWLVTSLGLVSTDFVPTPGATFAAFVDTSLHPYRGHILIVHLAISLYRVIIGFLASVLIAVPIGLLIGTYRWADSIISPLNNFFRAIPPLAYYTLLLIWFGLGEPSKIMLLFLTGFPPLMVNAAAGVHSVRSELLSAARSLGANRWQVFRYVIFPGALPDIFAGLRITMANVYSTLVAAELVAAHAGIGWLVLDAARFLRSDIIFVGIICMGVTGMTLDFALVILQRRAVPWLGVA